MRDSMRAGTLFLLFSLVALIFSCADSLPKILEIRKTLVYDFADENTAPTQRLVLFVNPTSNERRLDYVELVQSDGEYRWHIENPEEIKIGNKYFFGSTKIRMQDDVSFPEALYDCYYYDLADRMASKRFFLTIPSSLKNIPLNELRVEGFENKVYGSECPYLEIVIYDILKNPLYIGKITAEQRSVDAIKDAYPQAVSYRKYLRNNDYSIAVLYPEIQIAETFLDVSDTNETDGMVDDSMREQNIPSVEAESLELETVESESAGQE